MRNKYNSNYFENRQYFQDTQTVEKTYGKIQKLLSFLIILHLYSFFVSLIIFEFENNALIEHLRTTKIHNSIIVQIHPKRFILVVQTVVNCFIICIEFIYIKLELTLMNQRNLSPNAKK
jgi:hypothetical protein